MTMHDRWWKGIEDGDRNRDMDSVHESNVGWEDWVETRACICVFCSSR